MQLMLPFCLLCMVVSQQILNVTSFTSYDSEKRRFPITRRLGAPLMGRSIITDLDNDLDLTAYQSNSNEIHHLNKRRFGVQLLNRKKWMRLKKKGPLFG